MLINMNLIKNLIKLTISFLIALLISLLLFEYYLSSNKERFHSYGWVQSNQINKIIKECKSLSKDKNITGVFGDSFVEYYRGSKENISYQLKKLIKEDNICNFGISGSGIDVYYHRLNKVIEEIPNISRAIIFLYEGNDFVQVSEFSRDFDVYKYDRSLGFTYELLKKSAALNFIWREIIKKHLIPSNKFDIMEISQRKLEFCETTQEHIEYIIKKMSKELLNDFKTQQLNTNLFKLALTCPNFYKMLNSQKNMLSNYPKISFYIDEMNKIAFEKNINITFVIIPSDFYFNSDSRNYWIDTFQFNEYSHRGKTKISKLLLENYNNITFAENLKSSDYLMYDGHLNPKGVNTLAKWVADNID